MGEGNKVRFSFMSGIKQNHGSWIKAFSLLSIFICYFANKFPKHIWIAFAN